MITFAGRKRRKRRISPYNTKQQQYQLYFSKNNSKLHHSKFQNNFNERNELSFKSQSYGDSQHQLLSDRQNCCKKTGDHMNISYIEDVSATIALIFMQGWFQVKFGLENVTTEYSEENSTGKQKLFSSCIQRVLCEVNKEASEFGDLGVDLAEVLR